ncbi:aromatic ring-hydroxylating dioxygenase subunit alpha [Mycolicibacterium pulveris]|uniref:(2Fe-2S)-binding protein n=1 Tax=Mycolicibacterium pulveris TaxID=36813 RepID=A0A7I7UNK1_MYCPV|nr:aromatic ring-hydroxylating dioxygenase subunit alpha [Mycolicibacterium pulveris]MCV6981119.1 aromatic ring-hydroxylating dioxygenase subunit alpha [Mycolicibacterium pulveris]BBY82443.1 (2Fe-2S)-binding protein [Mycolicibacterium pulveris]
MTATAQPGTQRDYHSTGPELGIRDRYTSADFARLENEKLWPRVWQVACRIEEVQNPGDFCEYQIGDQSILIVRTEAGEIKALHNVCQHRGMRLKDGRGSTREIRCRSHSWCWNLDGSLKEVIDPQDFDQNAISPQALRLPECKVEVWAGFVFINMDQNAAPLHEFLGPVRERVEHYGIHKMVCTRLRSAVVDCNWKLGHEAFIETYHAVGTHPQALRYLDDTGMIYEQHGDHGMHRIKPGNVGRPSARLGDDVGDRKDILLALTADLAEFDYYNEADVEMANALLDTAMALPEDVSMGTFFADVRRQQAKAEGIDLSGFDDSELLAGELWNIFPNFTIPCNAGNALILRFTPNGLNHEQCIIDIYYMKLFADGAERPPMEFEFYEDWRDTKAWGTVAMQDFTNLPFWQRGVHSRGFRGPLWGRPDGNVSNLHRALSEYLAK